MATITLEQIEGDVTTVVADAQEILTFLEKIAVYFPAPDQTLITQAQNVVNVVQSVLAALHA